MKFWNVALLACSQAVNLLITSMHAHGCTPTACLFLHRAGGRRPAGTVRASGQGPWIRTLGTPGPGTAGTRDPGGARDHGAPPQVGNLKFRLVRSRAPLWAFGANLKVLARTQQGLLYGPPARILKFRLVRSKGSSMGLRRES